MCAHGEVEDTLRDVFNTHRCNVDADCCYANFCVAPPPAAPHLGPSTCGHEPQARLATLPMKALGWPRTVAASPWHRTPPDLDIDLPESSRARARRRYPLPAAAWLGHRISSGPRGTVGASSCNPSRFRPVRFCVDCSFDSSFATMWCENRCPARRQG